MRSCVDMAERDFSTVDVNIKRLLIRYGEIKLPIIAPNIPPTSMAASDINVIPKIVSVRTEFGSSNASTVSPCLDKTIPRTVKSKTNIALSIFSGILKFPLN